MLFVPPAWTLTLDSHAGTPFEPPLDMLTTSDDNMMESMMITILKQ